jgi:putative ABC transport system permease protein
VLRLALANLHRPAAQTGRLVVALGLGLTLFATLAVIETNLGGQIRTTIPAKAPSFFLLDIPVEEVGRFRSVAARAAPGAELTTVPSLRGSVVAVKGQRVSEMRSIPEGAWFLRGDRGLTYSATLPEGSRLVEGRWWPADYSGPPLVSLDVEAARAAGLKVGDSITVSILGREIDATIARCARSTGTRWGSTSSSCSRPERSKTRRTASWPPSPCPKRRSASSRARWPTTSLAFRRSGSRKWWKRWPGCSANCRSPCDRPASVAILAGIAVLVGALAASRRARIYDSVMLKLLGATRGRILLAQALEFGLLALVLAAVSFALGAGAGWYVVTRVLELDWAPDWGVVGGNAGCGRAGDLILRPARVAAGARPRAQPRAPHI